MKVLVIEDEPLIREIFYEFLTILGHDAHVVANGREGLARFAATDYDVVLTDFLLPGMTGLAIAQAIRAQDRSTPIIMISGSAEPLDERDAIAAGLTFLRKPLGLADLEAALSARGIGARAS